MGHFDNSIPEVRAAIVNYARDGYSSPQILALLRSDFPDDIAVIEASLYEVRRYLALAGINMAKIKARLSPDKSINWRRRYEAGDISYEGLLERLNVPRAVLDYELTKKRRQRLKPAKKITFGDEDYKKEQWETEPFSEVAKRAASRLAVTIKTTTPAAQEQLFDVINNRLSYEK